MHYSIYDVHMELKRCMWLLLSMLCSAPGSTSITIPVINFENEIFGKILHSLSFKL